MREIEELCERFFGRGEISYEDWLDEMMRIIKEEIDRRVEEELKWRESLGKG